MTQGLHGKRVAQHLGLVNSTSLALNPPSGRNLVLTHLRAPDGLANPSKRIAPENAYIVSVELQRPGFVKGWGTSTNGRFKPVTFWDLGGIEILDLRADPVVQRGSSFETVHVYIPDATLRSYADEVGLSEIPTLQAEAGTKDDVLLRWTRTLLPFFSEMYRLPSLALDELVLMFCSYLIKTYGTTPKVQVGGTGELALWQKRRASRILHERISDDLTLADLAMECRLSPSHFARAFKRSFGIPAHQYLIQQRVEMAKNLLLHSNLSLLSIALECGFADQSAFNRSFRSLVRTSPGAWQRTQRSVPVTIAFSSGRELIPMSTM